MFHYMLNTLKCGLVSIVHLLLRKSAVLEKHNYEYSQSSIIASVIVEHELHASMLTKSAFFLPEPSWSQSLQTTGGGGKRWVEPQGVNSRPPMIGSSQLGIPPSLYNLDTPTFPGGNSK